MQALDLAVSGGLITVQLAGGVPRRPYVAKITIGFASGRELQVGIGISVSPLFATGPYVDPPSRGFGTPITWTSGASIFAGAFLAVATDLAATGTSQADALLLPAQTNVFGTVPAGAGGILADTIASGTIVVQNTTDTDLFIYPPDGAQIGTLGVNTAVIVSANQVLAFRTRSATAQWYAG
jgi:hypothetical protein